MTELVDIKRVVIGPDTLTARVRIAEEAPLMTSEDVEGTARVYRLLPHIVEHACRGDVGTTFREAMGDTEIAHLLEHVTVELLAQTDLAGDTPTGRTWVEEVGERTYEIELVCPDDVLVASALSCGVWILDWAYSGGEEPEPDVEAIVAGLVSLVESVEGQGEDLVVDYGGEPADQLGFGERGLDEPEADEAWDENEEDEVPGAEGPEDEGFEPDDAVEPEAAPSAGAGPAREASRSLWTSAPTTEPAERTAHEQRTPEVEAEVDQIMATIEMTPISDPGDESEG